MTHVEFVHKLRGQVWKMLQQKTGWGRNEVLELLDRACINTLSKAMDELEAAGRQPKYTLDQLLAQCDPSPERSGGRDNNDNHQPWERVRDIDNP